MGVVGGYDGRWDGDYEREGGKVASPRVQILIWNLGFTCVVEEVDPHPNPVDTLRRPRVLPYAVQLETRDIA
jgi:hypothetical protein